MKNKPKRPPKTLKERAWFTKTLQYLDGTKAAMEVYNVSTKDSARAIASQNFSKLSFDEILDSNGLTDNYTVGGIKEGTQAMKIHGSPDDFIEIPDHQTRHKFLETTLRLKGRGLNSKREAYVDNRIQYVFTVPTRIPVGTPPEASTSFSKE